mmetsp:Transcript_31835/g.94615  ORF Transcript_31835/g.94615 Transcript_31835/m.94615 type:complete len:291 (-) Transcript_31835:332-1204(-)
MMSGMRPPARTSSKRTFVLRVNLQISSSVPPFFVTPSYGYTSITSPISIFETSISMGNDPESSIVLKKMGAILLPMQMPPVLLLGTLGMSTPMYHRMEFVADFRDEPVPTTSPTYASGMSEPPSPAPLPCAMYFSITSLQPSCWPVKKPSARSNLSIANACSGMSGRDHASGAGERSSVLVSPATLKTVKVSFSLTSGFEVNHSAAAHDSMTFFAYSLPASIFALTSWNASNTRIVCLSAVQAVSATSASSSASISGAMLYPPCMVPSSSTAFFLLMRAFVSVPLARAAR